jgi:hypothetical protein
MSLTLTKRRAVAADSLWQDFAAGARHTNASAPKRGAHRALTPCEVKDSGEGISRLVWVYEQPVHCVAGNRGGQSHNDEAHERSQAQLDPILFLGGSSGFGVVLKSKTRHKSLLGRQQLRSIFDVFRQSVKMHDFACMSKVVPFQLFTR